MCLGVTLAPEDITMPRRTMVGVALGLVMVGQTGAVQTAEESQKRFLPSFESMEALSRYLKQIVDANDLAAGDGCSWKVTRLNTVHRNALSFPTVITGRVFAMDGSPLKGAVATIPRINQGAISDSS